MFLPFAHFQIPKTKPIVDSGFPVSEANWAVYAMALSGNKIFIAGAFTSIGGVSRNKIAALDSNSGEILPLFQGLQGANGTVTAMIVVGSMLVIGGSFTSVNGVARNGIAALDLSNANVLPWYPNGGIAGGSLTVNDFCVKNNSLYLCGNFTSIGGVSRNGIAALDVTTAGVLSWYPNGGVLGGEGYRLLLSSDTNKVYIGGSFTQIGGVGREKIAAFDASTGSVIGTWGPTSPPAGAGASPHVKDMVQIGNTLFIGGAFGVISGQGRLGFAALNANTGTLLDLYPTNLGGDAVKPNIMTFASKNNQLHFAGFFSSVGGETRLSIACLDAVTMQVLPWYPPSGVGNLTSKVSKGFSFLDNTWWLNGNFQSMGGITCNNLVKLNL
ncbi:hypothetical protein [Leptospira alstonii]|uniref:Beta-propeller repeat protein n=1 Tax=Leptospira alstonii serovar Sichuan str. 79601 TaxID=1218565 RepID=M6D2T1_9LEPT|nr:hypothetical protein [Leptospira alstonii]AGS80521.1 hypothetical protein LEP1GSC193_0755 [Leptospira phage vB_LalZ_80412-LE1]EMJ95498.1 hypothetical protein LEP1GSC194_3554 [Leptospira alstonii serovar Sichuan str. 79601]